MSLFELLLIAVGLSMDAFAVSICKGLSIKKMNWKNALICGIFFGSFQALMPLIGYFLGYGFRGIIQAYDHWIAFIVLAAIGISTIRGALADDEADAERNGGNAEPENSNHEEGTASKGSNLNSDRFDFMTMLPLAIATSIDALAVGVSFAFLKVNIWSSVLIIGITTFVLSAFGVKIGFSFGTRFKKKAELAGGIILILIGFKILMEHLGILG